MRIDSDITAEKYSNFDHGVCKNFNQELLVRPREAVKLLDSLVYVEA